MIKGKIPKLIIIAFVLLTFLFFYKIFSGNLPIPLDTLTGVNFPWLDYKWGYLVGIPVKNPAITDVIAQYYPWRDLVINIWKSGHVPLWNPYSFSGTPLAANWQSAPFYPLNILMLILGNKWGWTSIIVLQPLLSLVFMYLFLKELDLSNTSSIFGAIVYSFSGFMMIFLEYNSPAQAAIWLPLILLLIEKYIKKNNNILLPLLSVIIFIMLTAGNFQVSLYTFIIAFFYLIVRFFQNKLQGQKTNKILIVLFFIFVGIGLASVQLVPTFELFQNSIRQLDNNIVQYNYGLVPLKNIVTFLAPDFFGNPVTGNSWTLMYHETTGYFGIIAIPFILAAVFTKKGHFACKFFAGVLFISLLLLFDTPIGRLVYELKVPFISTSYASRILFLIDFSAAALAAIGIEKLTTNKKRILGNSIFVGILTIVTLITIYIATNPSKFGFQALSPETIAHLSISVRNMILPSALILTFITVLAFIKKTNLIYIAVIGLTVFDLFRFGLKYNTFSPQRLLYPTTPIFEFLNKNVGYFRIDREHANVLQPNSWMPYQLMSPSGYDPLYPKEYSEFYNVYNDSPPGNSYSRYNELNDYNSPYLDLAGVKYLVVVKRDKNGVIVNMGGESISSKIDGNKFKKVFEDKRTAVLENTTVMPRVLLFGSYDMVGNSHEALQLLYKDYDFRNRVIIEKDPLLPNIVKSPEDNIQIVEYSPNSVTLKSVTKGNTIAMLTDTFYPGWEVSVDGNKEVILRADGIFRAVAVPAGIHTIVFDYKPKSFLIGILISTGSLVILLLVFCKNIISRFSGRIRNRFKKF